ncbi:MAG: glycosyltransferase [Asticcacaulis sp.]
MRLLNIMLAKVRGGIETMSLRYHEALKASGADVLSLGHPQGVLAQHLPDTEFRAMNASVNHDPFAAFLLRRIALDFKPDLILTHGNRATSIALMPFVGVADKTVQVVHNFRHKPQVSRLKAAICVSGAVHASLAQAHPKLPLYEVANFGPLNVRPVKPAPTGMVTLGLLGRLHVNKGFDVMIRALAILRAGGADVRLNIAGDGPLKAELIQLTQALGLTDHIAFCGWAAQPADFLQGLDLFILPSRIEPFGLVVTESMAAGVPVIATHIDGPAEILQGGAFGILCTPNDPQALANAIRSAMLDWAGTLSVAKAAQAYALSRFSPEAGQARLNAALQQIVQNHP